jgi:hypothetical protein
MSAITVNVVAMTLEHHIRVGSKVEIFQTNDRTKGTVLDFDEHGIVLDEEGTKFYIPWATVASMRIDAMPDIDPESTVR